MRAHRLFVAGSFRIGLLHQSFAEEVFERRESPAAQQTGCPPKVVMCPSTGLVLSVDMIPSDEMNAPSGMPPPKDFAVQRMSGVTPACWK